MADRLLAAGVLGVAGYGIYRRSQQLAGEASERLYPLAGVPDVLRLPVPLERTSRQWVASQVSLSDGLAQQIGADLATFLTGDWVETNTLTTAPGVVEIAGQSWDANDLIRATALNVMWLVNDAQTIAIARSPEKAKLATVPFFDLNRTRPIDEGNESAIAAAVERIEAYIAKKVPRPVVPSS